MTNQWIKCPICGNKTRDKIREDTIIKNFPLFCPKCKKESLIDVENLTVNTLNARNNELDNLFEYIYEDNVSGKISDDRFAKR